MELGYSDINAGLLHETWTDYTPASPPLPALQPSVFTTLTRKKKLGAAPVAVIVVFDENYTKAARCQSLHPAPPRPVLHGPPPSPPSTFHTELFLSLLGQRQPDFFLSFHLELIFRALVWCGWQP